MLLVGSNAGQSTPAKTPIITFVHWTTTAPPNNPDPTVRQLSAGRYREVLWHLLLRGHDTFFLWCMGDELANVITLFDGKGRPRLARQDIDGQERTTLAASNPLDAIEELTVQARDQSRRARIRRSGVRGVIVTAIPAPAR